MPLGCACFTRRSIWVRFVCASSQLASPGWASVSLSRFSSSLFFLEGREQARVKIKICREHF